MRSRRQLSITALIAAAIITMSCGGRQSAVDAAGIQSERLESLWWLFFYITSSVYVIVILVLLIAWIRSRKSDNDTLPDAPNPKHERNVANVVKLAVGITVVVLFSLMITSFRAGKAINSLGTIPPHINIKVTGHQWWWEVEYNDESNPVTNIRTANEIHVPVGRPIKLDLQSNDVIHSLWMPNLHGKKDLVPIFPTTLYFQADKPGTYWGQCAEFCGYQHAKMRFVVVAESDDEFNSWINAGRQMPGAPASAMEARGQQIFTTGVCAQCHTVAGTGTNGRVGPDLTHIASRPYIAAGSLQNTPENLAAWVTDPQRFKPGIRMPMNQFSDEDLNALVAYLRSLK
jgi:cytochrome c oxidase subunit II